MSIVNPLNAYGANVHHFNMLTENYGIERDKRYIDTMKAKDQDLPSDSM